MKQLFSTDVEPDLGIEDLLDDFLTFFIAGETRLNVRPNYVISVLSEMYGIPEKQLGSSLVEIRPLIFHRIINCGPVD